MTATSRPLDATTGDTSAADAHEYAAAPMTRSVYVYEAPVRLWHWVNALSVTVLALTGWFIASPLPTQPGEASANFLMGYLRFAHFAAGYVFAIGFVARLYWAIVGNHHARELFSVPVLRADYWRELGLMLRWYAFLAPRPNRYVGHNPLARFAMFFVFVLLTLFMIVTGFAMYGEGQQAGSWADRWFGWVIPLFGQSQDVHTWHHLGLWVMVIFVIVHVYAAIREDIMGRQSIVSTMISGFRTFKD